MGTENFDFLNNRTTGILDELFDGVYIIDRNRKIIFWNRGAEMISGFSRDEMMGVLCHEGPLKHEDEKQCQLCENNCPAVNAMEYDREEMAVIFMHTITKKIIPVETHVRPLKDNNGKIIGAIEVFRDVTHWMKLEELSKEKDRLMGILAHDIRNPLSVVQTYSAFLVREKDSKIREIGEALQRRTNYALTLVNDMLDLKTIESGELSVNIEELDMIAAVRQAIANCTQVAELKNIKLTMLVKNHDLKFFMDAIRFEEVINNLISNAINYSHKGSIVEVIVDKYDKGVLFQVKDQGIGIKIEEQDKLFKAFGKTTNRPTAGESSNGLGLFIVKKIIDFFAGSIEVESSPKTGTIFMVKFPHAGCPVKNNN